LRQSLRRNLVIWSPSSRASISSLKIEQLYDFSYISSGLEFFTLFEVQIETGGARLVLKYVENVILLVGKS